MNRARRNFPRCGAPMTRRTMLKLTGTAALGGLFAPRLLLGADRGMSDFGCVIGHPAAEKIGARVLADGGNAIDAMVAAALTVAIASPNNTGIGGYALTAMIAADGGKRLAAIDGNMAAPAAARADMFKPGPDGKVPGAVNHHGWLSAGVPGIMAGLQLALDKFGTRSFRELVQPAIALAREGVALTSTVLTFTRNNPFFKTDPGSHRLYHPNGQPLREGELFRNPELAELLTALAAANSVEAFYRGDIAQRIAEGFQKNGGLVTARDLANYQARLVAPLAVPWDGFMLQAAPLTAGGLSVLQMLRALHALEWHKMPEGVARTHARLETMRLAWRDRVTLLGDPDFAKVPVEKLLSEDYARDTAMRVNAVVRAGKIIDHGIKAAPQGGTIHLTSADKHGNFVALTLTHGETFGACVTVDGLGLTLGHGMSRFDPRPEHPNAPGPGKRPLHNMSPAMVTRDGTPVLALGGAGGRRIPNSVFDVLVNFVALGRPLADAMAAPRVHTEGDLAVSLEKTWPAEEAAAIGKLGYMMKNTAAAAAINGIAVEGGALHSAMR